MDKIVGSAAGTPFIAQIVPCSLYSMIHLSSLVPIVSFNNEYIHIITDSWNFYA